MTETIFIVAGVVAIICGLVAMVYFSNKESGDAIVEPSDAAILNARNHIAGAATVDALCAETVVQVSELIGSTGSFVSIDGKEARSGTPLTIESETMIRLSRERLMVKQGHIVAVPVLDKSEVVGLVAAQGGHTESLTGIGKCVSDAYSRLTAPQFARATAEVDFDGLTGVGDRRRFDQDLAGVVAESGDEQLPVSLAMFDIDDFRYYNEAHGKQAGNEVLRSIAALIASNLRETDVVYRYSGVKFVAMLPGATVENGYAVVERIRKEVESTRFEGQEVQPSGRVTMSIGIAEAPADQTDNLIEAADAALAAAKESGRNKVVIEADIR